MGGGIKGRVGGSPPVPGILALFASPGLVTEDVAAKAGLAVCASPFALPRERWTAAVQP